MTRSNQPADPAAALFAAVTEYIRAEVSRQLAAANANAPPTELLTIAQAAEHVSVAPRTLRRWIRSGRLDSVGAGKLTRIRRCDLEAVIRDVGTSPDDPEALALARFG